MFSCEGSLILSGKSKKIAISLLLFFFGWISILSPKHALAAACPFGDGNGSYTMSGDMTVTADTTNKGYFDCSNLTLSTHFYTLHLVSYSNPSNSTFYGVTIKLKNLTVGSNIGTGYIDANGTGWAGGAATQNGNGPGGGAGASGTASARAGGYGGLGGGDTNLSGGGTYGNPSSPVELGSGGGGVNSLAGGAGGGAIKIIATNSISLNHGIIQANGGTGDAVDISNVIECSGGGSGGSVWLDTPSLSVQNGSSIKALAGTNNNPFCSSWAGGGGRIKLPTSLNHYDAQAGNGSVDPEELGANVGSQYASDGVTQIAVGGTAPNSVVQLTPQVEYIPEQPYGVQGAGSGVNNIDSLTTDLSSIDILYKHVAVFGENKLFTAHITYQGSESISGVTLNDGSSTYLNMTKGCSSSVNNLHSEIWYLFNAGANSTTHYVTATFTGAGVTHAGVNVNLFSNVDSSNPVASAVCNQSSSPGSDPTIALAPNSNQLGIGSAVITSNSSLVPNSSTLPLSSQIGGNYIQSTGSITAGSGITWHASTASDWATAGLILNEVSDGSNNIFHAQAEVQMLGTNFTNTANLITPFFFNGRRTQVVMPFNASSTGSYHWQYQICDSHDANCDGWQPFAYNPETSADFVVTSTVNSPDTPTSLGASNVTDGSTSTNQQPAFAFFLSDSNGGNQVGYELQIATDSQFSYPVMDYVSGMGAQGANSFTVGQAAGSGYYLVGGSGQNLNSNDYYWRVNAINQNSATSAFAAANSGAMAFRVNASADTTGPIFSFTASASGTVANGAINSYTGTATDETAMATVEYTVDGGSRVDLYPDTTNPLSYTFTIDPNSLSLSLGAHTIDFYADDTSSNEVHQSFSINIVNDTTQPTLNFTTSASGDVQTNQIQFIGTATDDVAMASVGFDIDGNSRADASPVTTDPLSYTFNLDLTSYHIPVGGHTIDIFADDSSGNETLQTFSINVISGTGDTTAPIFSFTASASGNVTANQLIYTGTATDETAMTSVEYVVDGGARTNANPTTTDPLSYPFSIDLTSLNLGLGAHTVDIYADDTSSNEVHQSFSITVVTDSTPPVLTFTATPSAYVKNPVVITGTATDETAMASVQYTVDGGTKTDAAPDTTNPLSYPFTLSLTLSDGAHTVVIYADDTSNNETTQTFTFIDSSTVAPSCTAGWFNQPIPMYSAILPYNNIHCTGPIPIVSAEYSVYHNAFGGIVGPTPVTSVSGVANTDETYNFSVDLTGFGNIDGTMEIAFIVTDAAGNTSYDYDPVTLAATDNTAPTINFDQITPNPLSDTQPTITGSCRDDTPLAKNTNISNMNYSVDGGSNIDIDPLDHSYNDVMTKNFSTKLDPLSLGVHMVTVNCTDGNSNTNTKSQNFTIVAPSNPVPGTFNYTENFTSTVNQDIPNSDNMVWGNGKLRLKEDITTTRTLINSTGHCPIYADCRTTGGVTQDPVDPNTLYYYLGDQFYIYNTQTQTNTQWDYESEFGIGNYGRPTVFSLGVYQGKEYMWLGNIYGLTIVNMTDHTHVDKAISNLNGIVPDFARGRLAAYLQGDAPTGYSNIAYLDLNGTLTDTSDDTYTRIPLSTVNSVSFLFPMQDAAHNYVYWAAYNDGLYKWDDHNNPGDVANYTVTHINDYRFGNVWSMILDPQNNLIYGTANNGGQGIYVVKDNGHPLDFSQQTVTQIAFNRQLGYKDVDGLKYVTGQNGVGDQLIINSGNDDPTYFNFNSNYDTLTDKTFITLNMVDGLRPDAVSFLMTDYNGGYALIKNQGFFKIDLHRGWASTGSAVSLPPRPSQALVVDNFIANANPGGTIAYVPGTNSPTGLMAKIQRALVPTALASGGSGIQYFVSTDGGVTWTEVTLGQLQQLQQNDYRVKFKIVMTPVNGASPVLDSYSLAYAGYASQAQQGTTVGLGVSASNNSPRTGDNFSVTVQGVDVAGYLTPNYTGHVTLSLVDANSLSPVSGFSASTADISSGGTTTLNNVQISQQGTFKIKVTDGNYTNYSVPITVGAPNSLTQPTLSFWGDKYTITPGQSVALHWSSTNVTSWVIQPGNVTQTSASGNYLVSPTQTTTYTITGSGPNGSVSNSVTIVVTGSGSGAGAGNGAGGNSSSNQASGSAAPTLTASGSGTTADLTGLTITGSSDQSVVKGEKAIVSWSVPNADQVTIDFPSVHQVGSSGSFEFYPTSSVVITITAIKNQITSTKVITITVLDAPIPVQQAVKTLQSLFPGIVPLLNITFKSSQTVPKIGLGAAAAVEAVIMTLLVTSVASQIGFAAALNGKTIINLLSSLGIFPAKKRKGFVHQTKTGAPIAFALISVYADQPAGLVSTANQLPVVTLVSDVYGVYNDPFLAPGSYHFVAAHGDNAFPSQLHRPVHLSLKDFYKGEQLTVTSAKNREALLIPMDEAVAAEHKHVWRTKLLLGLNRTLNALQWLVYPFTFLALLAVAIDPNLFNVIIVIIYALILVPKLIKLFRRPVLQGQVTVNLNRQPVVNASVMLSTPQGEMVALSKTDRAGKFAFYAPKGEYAVNVIATNLVWNEVQAGTLYTVKATGIKTPIQHFTMSKIENPF